MKQLSILFTLLFALLIMTSAEAQKPIARQAALNHMLKTNRAIGFAHMAVKRGKVYTGDLGKAVRHQRFAKSQFEAGNYAKAVQHSRKARLHASEAVKANKVKANTDFTFTPEENELTSNMPADKDLEEEVKNAVAELKDEDLINNNNLNIDVK